MKLSDFVIHYLADLGIKHVFVVTGGYAVNLIDSFHNEPRIKFIAVNHEQVAAMAAETYSRFAGLSAVITTNAPGALNLLNGIDGAWNDSIPCVFICGQVTRSRWNRTKDKTKGREIVDIVTIASSITKYSAYVEEPEKIKYHLDIAVSIAKEGRPGPVLLDIPLDVQKSNINENELEGFRPKSKPLKADPSYVETRVREAWELIKKAQRPVVLLGGGIRISDSVHMVRSLIENLNIPTVATWCAFDILPHDHPNYLGTIGTYGNRRANYTIQNSDLVLILGARLNERQTGGNPKTFAREAVKIRVDLHELEKDRIEIDLPINCHLEDFLDSFMGLIQPTELAIGAWREKTRYYRENFTEVLPEYYEQKGSVNVYVFMRELSKIVPADVPVIVDCGGNLIWMMQAYEVKEGQRAFSNMGLSSMGYALAASIGVCLANDKKPVVCLIGDGGLQVHSQELQTIKYHNLPIKIFVINNKSYGIIKQTIASWFEIENLEALKKRCLAVSENDGYSCPNFIRLAEAYGITAITIRDNSSIFRVGFILDWEGPTLCDVVIDEHQVIAPRLEFGRPLEDQHPLVDRQVLKKVMMIKDQTESVGEIIGI